MRAQYILLTHFSQRYPKIPNLETGNKIVGVAFDLMRVAFSKLHLIPKMLPVVSRLVDEEQEEKEKSKEMNKAKMEKKKVKTHPNKKPVPKKQQKP
jgi:ribonuclease Z